MRIVFVSNFLNHHQQPLCNAFLRMENVEFKFVAVEAIPQERMTLGYSDMNMYDFVLRTYDNEMGREHAVREMKRADVLICGVNLRDYLCERDMKEKLIFLYLERTFKNIQLNVQLARNIIRMIKNHTWNKSKNTYVLCAGAYVAPEFVKFRAYIGKMYKWGYFPEVYIQKKEKIEKLKRAGDVRLLWVGRFLHWKQPQQALYVARELKKKGYKFKLDMIGSGELEEQVMKNVYDEQLVEHINIVGAIPFIKVREYMERANIFLFTSNREEGWGAVLNEAMSSRCAVVANRWIGAVPFLIQHEKNGLIYDGTVEDLLLKTESFISDRERQLEYGEEAYNTMITCWNADVAAKNFVQLSRKLLSGKGYVKDMKGPCEYIG